MSELFPRLLQVHLDLLAVHKDFLYEPALEDISVHVLFLADRSIHFDSSLLLVVAAELPDCQLTHPDQSAGSYQGTYQADSVDTLLTPSFDLLLLYFRLLQLPWRLRQ